MGYSAALLWWYCPTSFAQGKELYQEIYLAALLPGFQATPSAISAGRRIFHRRRTSSSPGFDLFLLGLTMGLI